jgi:hypothetical protein
MDSQGHCVVRISWRDGVDQLAVSFVEDIPARRGVSVATSIDWNLGSPQEKRDYRFTKAILSFGHPTLTDGGNPWTIAMWCKDFRCTDMNGALQGQRSGIMLLVHRGSGLSLTNDRYAAERQAVIFAARGITLQP